MYDEDGGWSKKSATKKHSRWALPGWIALVLTISTISIMGIMKPSGHPVPTLDPGEEVSAFTTEVLVLSDGSLSVTERSRTNLQGQKTRHGISRRLPAAYPDGKGGQTLIAYSDHYATIEMLDPPSAPVRLPVNTHGSEERFITYRIGDIRTPLIPARYEFVFQYIAQGVVQAFDEGKHSGFVWDITGGLVHPIEQASIRVKVPRSVDAASLVYGADLDLSSASLASVSRDIEARVEHSGDDTFVTFRAKRPMESFEHFVIKVVWPANSF